MKIFFSLLYFFISFKIIYSYITFPLLKDIPSFSSDDTPSDIMKKMFNSNLYITMNIGSENIEVKAYLTNERNELMIAGNKIKNHKYNENNSLSYNCTYCKEKEFPYGKYNKGVISTENFRINFNEKEIKVVNKMNFILGTNSIYLNHPEAFVGLILPFYDSEIDYNLIYSLKRSNSINSYIWFFNFTENNSKIVIDAFPHDLEKNKYDASYLENAEALNEGYYLSWGLRFTKIYYSNEKNDIDLSKDKGAKFDFSINYILAPNDTSIYLDNLFFNEYYTKNICFKKEIEVEKKYYFIYCKNTEDLDQKKFQKIYFKSVDLSSIFALDYNDLFFYKDNYIYFLILFHNEMIWNFGELFLKKYQLVFNQDNKNLSFYKNLGEKIDNNTPDNNSNNFNYTALYIILLVLILAGVIVILIVVILKKGKRKYRANELDDNFEYEAKKDDNNEAIIKPENDDSDNKEGDNKLLSPD